MQPHFTQHALNVACAFQVMCEDNKAPTMNAGEADAIACAAQTCAQVARSLADLGMARVLFQVLSNSRLDDKGYAALSRTATEIEAATKRLTPPPEPTITEWWIQYRPGPAPAGWQNCACYGTYEAAHADLITTRPGHYRIIGVTQS